jgi:hypothetical protein
MAEKGWGREERVGAEGAFIGAVLLGEAAPGAGEATGRRRSFREVEEEWLVCLKARRWACGGERQDAA